MITLAEKRSFSYIPKISFMQTACLSAAFDGSALAPDIWVQRVCGWTSAVISKYGGRLYITAENADFKEIREFIKLIGFSEIFSEKDTAVSLGYENFETFTVLKKRVKKQEDFSLIPPLKCLYSALDTGSDGDISLPDFESFAADLSHRLRHSGAVAAAEEFGAALAFKSEFGGIINGIAVDKENRKKGNGSRLLKKICGYLDGDIFVCTNKNTAKFYIKNGFTECDKAVLIRG